MAVVTVENGARRTDVDFGFVPDLSISGTLWTDLNLDNKYWLDHNANDRLLREAQILAGLGHANIVTVYGIGTWNERLYFKMEWIDGQDGRQWLSADTRDWRAVVVAAGEEPAVAALGSAGERAVQAVAARLIQVETVPIVATTPRLSVRIIRDRHCPKDATLRSISTFWIVRMSLTSLENLR